MTRRRQHFAIAVLAVVLGGTVWLWGRTAGRREAELAAEARAHQHALVASRELNATVRMLLHDRMGRHASTAERLWQSYLAVDYTAIAANAAELADEPGLRQPAPDEDPALLNNTIPADFFLYQADLERGALALSRAAADADATRVVAAFQQTTASCFACHFHYRTGARQAAGVP